MWAVALKFCVRVQAAIEQLSADDKCVVITPSDTRKREVSISQAGRIPSMTML